MAKAKRKFRLYFKTPRPHPAVIIIEYEGMAIGYAITHSPKSGNSSNLPLSRNPKTGDLSKAYLHKQRRKGIIGRDWSSYYLEGYELSEKDESLVDSLEQKKARTLVAEDQLYSRARNNIPQKKKRHKHPKAIYIRVKK